MEMSLLLPAACRGQIYALNMQYSPQGAFSNVPANSVLVAFSPGNITSAPSPGDFKVQLAGIQQAGEVLSIIPYQQPQSYLVQVSAPTQEALHDSCSQVYAALLASCQARWSSLCLQPWPSSAEQSC